MDVQPCSSACRVQDHHTMSGINGYGYGCAPLSTRRTHLFPVLSHVALSVHICMRLRIIFHRVPITDLTPAPLTFTAHSSSGEAQVGKFQPCLHHSQMRHGGPGLGRWGHLWTVAIVFRGEELVTQIMQECDSSDHSSYPGAPMTSADTTPALGTK